MSRTLLDTTMECAKRVCCSLRVCSHATYTGGMNTIIAAAVWLHIDTLAVDIDVSCGLTLL